MKSHLQAQSCLQFQSRCSSRAKENRAGADEARHTNKKTYLDVYTATVVEPMPVMEGSNHRTDTKEEKRRESETNR